MADKSNNRPGGLSRRDLLKNAAAAGLGLSAGVQDTPQAAATMPTDDNLIKRENAKTGTRDWLLTKTLTDSKKGRSNIASGRCPSIEGYCSANSVRAGEKLQIMVSTSPASAFKLEIFRTGYYNGDGARLVRNFDSLQGTPQPDPPVGENYLRECQWEPAVVNWPSDLRREHPFTSSMYI